MTKQIRLDVLVEHELPGIRALDPEVLRRVPAFRNAADLRADDVRDPVHRLSLRALAGAPSAHAGARRSAHEASATGRARSSRRRPCRAASSARAQRLRPAPSRPPRHRRRAAIAGRARRVPDAEADRDRQRGVALDPRDRRRDAARIGRGRAGDAGDRDVVDEARGVGEHGRQPLVVGGRRREADEVRARPRSAGRQSSSSSSGGRSTTIRPSTPAASRRRRKRVDAVDVDRVVVAHQHDRRVVVARAERGAPGRAS